MWTMDVCLTTPQNLRNNGGKRYTLLSGHHRYWCYRVLVRPHPTTVVTVAVYPSGEIIAGPTTVVTVAVFLHEIDAGPTPEPRGAPAVAR